MSPDPSAPTEPATRGGDGAKAQQRRRIGLFGGTFDPPHIGHLIVAETVRDAMGLDEVRLVVANNPWQKTSERIISSASFRLDMVQAALGRHRGVVASDIEIELGGPSYTIVTLEHLQATEPDTDWYVIVGADAAAGLDTWHRASELADMVELVVVNRPGEVDSATGELPGPPPGWRWTPIEVPAIGVSSTMLRERVAAGRSIWFLTPEAVVTLVDDHLLYRRP